MLDARLVRLGPQSSICSGRLLNLRRWRTPCKQSKKVVRQLLGNRSIELERRTSSVRIMVSTLQSHPRRGRNAGANHVFVRGVSKLRKSGRFVRFACDKTSAPPRYNQWKHTPRHERPSRQALSKRTRKKDRVGGGGGELKRVTMKSRFQQ